MTGEPAQFIKGKTIQEQMMQILKMLRDQADAIQEQIDDLQGQIDDIGLQSITPIIDGTYAAGRAVADESGNDIEDTYAPLTALSDGSVTQVGTANVGDDLKPIKLVGGVPTAVTYDLVDAANNQNIDGTKTFSQNIFGKGDTRLLDVNYILGTPPASDAWSKSFRVCDKNGDWVSACQLLLKSNGKNEERIIVRDSSGTTGQLTLLTTHALAPSRAYDPANIDDIATIGSLAANPDIIHPVYTKSSITFKTLAGLTITPTDNFPSAHVYMLCGNIIVINVSIVVTGTFTGTTGWTDLYDLPSLNNLQVPCIVSIKNQNSSKELRILNGNRIYLTNGQTYSNDRFEFQIVGTYNG